MADQVTGKTQAGAPAIIKKRMSPDFGTVAANISEEVTGAFSDDELVADAGDGVYWSPAQALTAGLVNGGGRVSETGVVALAIGNTTTGTLTPNTVTMDVYVTKGGTET